MRKSVLFGKSLHVLVRKPRQFFTRFDVVDLLDVAFSED
jgi:hypothetical protein